MSRSLLTPEQSYLLDASKMAWKRRGRAKGASSFLSEETVTETILQDLPDAFPGTLEVVQFSKRKEGETGSDWAWVFRNAPGTRNFPMLVQAKALDLKDVAYSGLGQLVGDTDVRQIDRLLERSAEWDWPALYTFYNHLSLTSRIPDSCGTLSRARARLPESWGISVADADVVRQALDQGDKSFDTHRAWSLPLHCLLCSGGSGTRNSNGSPEQARSALVRLRQFQSDGPLGSGGRAARSSEPIRSELPDLFSKAVEANDLRDPDRRARRLEALAQENPGLAGVVVVQDQEGGEPVAPRPSLKD